MEWCVVLMRTNFWGLEWALVVSSARIPSFLLRFWTDLFEWERWIWEQHWHWHDHWQSTSCPLDSSFQLQRTFLTKQDDDRHETTRNALKRQGKWSVTLCGRVLQINRCGQWGVVNVNDGRISRPSPTTSGSFIRFLSRRVCSRKEVGINTRLLGIFWAILPFMGRLWMLTTGSDFAKTISGKVKNLTLRYFSKQQGEQWKCFAMIHSLRE